MSAFRSGFFNLRVDQCELPDQRVMPRYYVMEFPDWVNVVPITTDGQMILVEQYRHAAGEMCLEIPGGSTNPVNPNDLRTGEDVLTAAKRELREETGYVSDDWVYCGFHYPNPALQNNKMHTYLARNCRLEGEPELDAFEDLQVRTMKVEDVLEALKNGDVRHSLIAASIHLARRFLADLA